MSFSPFYKKLEEKERNEGVKERLYGAMDKPLVQQFCKYVDLCCVKTLEP